MSGMDVYRDKSLFWGRNFEVIDQFVAKLPNLMWSKWPRTYLRVMSSIREPLQDCIFIWYLRKKVFDTWSRLFLPNSEIVPRDFCRFLGYFVKDSEKVWSTDLKFLSLKWHNNFGHKQKPLVSTCSRLIAHWNRKEYLAAPCICMEPESCCVNLHYGTSEEIVVAFGAFRSRSW